MSLVINNKMLFDSGMYRDLHISLVDDVYKVKVKRNIIDKYELLSNIAKERIKCNNSKVEEISNLPDDKQLEEVISYFINGNKIDRLGIDKYFYFGNYERKCIVKLSSKGHKKEFEQIFKAYNEHRMRTYNPECKRFNISSLYECSLYLTSEDSQSFNFYVPYNKKIYSLPLKIDRDFLAMFLREQIIDKDGEVLLEEGEYESKLRIGDTIIEFDDDLASSVKYALKYRNERIEKEKRKQFSLDI